MNDRFKAPILYYHRVAPDADPMTGLTPAIFRKQMLWLRSLGFIGTSLERALDWPSNETAQPIALTFDDGYEDNFEYAAPILLELGFVATIYFVVDRIGKNVDWSDDPVWGGHRLMDASAARELVSKGFEAGSHTLTHPDLSRTTEIEARCEIGESRLRLTQMLSTDVTTFCYPYGSYRPLHPIMVRESGYRAARTVHRYRLFGNSDLYQLACRPVSGRMKWSRFLFSTGCLRLGIKGGDVS